MIEQVISVEMLQRTGSLFYFYRTHAGAEIDLIIDRGSERIGYEFKCSVSINRKDYANLESCINDGIIHKGFVVYMGERNFSVSDQIEIIQGERMLFSQH